MPLKRGGRSSSTGREWLCGVREEIAPEQRMHVHDRKPSFLRLRVDPLQGRLPQRLLVVDVLQHLLRRHRPHVRTALCKLLLDVRGPTSTALPAAESEMIRTGLFG